MQNEPFENNEENLDKVCEKIDGFKANFGGTEILSPLKDILDKDIRDHDGKQVYKKIFVCTDGAINNEH